MKEEVKVSAVQFAAEWLQLETNIKRMSKFVEAEAKAGQELIVFPELANIGYITPVMAGDLVDFADGMTNTEFATRYVRAAETIPGPTTEAISQLAKRYSIYVVVGIAEKHPIIPATLYNSGVLIGPHGVIGVHHKMHLPLIEKLYFYAGNESQVFKTELGNIGIELCYEGDRFPELSRILALKGAEIICCGWAWPASASSLAPEEARLKYTSYARAHENCVFFISANRSGKQGNSYFLGGSAIAAPAGIMAYSETTDEEVIRAVLTDEQLVSYRSVLNIFRDRRPELYGPICQPLSESYKPHTSPERSKESTFNPSLQ